jgi:hypothetical protein
MAAASLIDRFLPQYQFAEQHQLPVAATPAALLDQAEDTHMGDDPLVLRMIALREAPARLAQRLGLGARLPARPFGLADFTPLGRNGDEELAFGLAGRFWHADYGLLPIADGQAFGAAAHAPVARLVLNFTARPQPDGRTLLATETRVHCPDAATLRRFRPYWMLIRPVSGLIRRRLLQRIASAAQNVSLP